MSGHQAHLGTSGGTGADRYLFLCGADMEPTLARTTYPGARFVARAKLSAGGGTAADEVWGILLRVPVLPATDAADEERDVVTDDGRRFQAVAVGGGRPTGDPAAVLAAARYWELPPAYVRRLPAPPVGGAGDDG